MDERTVRGHLDLLLLAALRDEPLHGYAIITKLRLRSEGTFDLNEGAVYPALHKLEQEALLSSSWTTDGGRRRRIYRLTRKGHKALETKEHAWQRLVEGVQAVLAEKATR